MQPCKNNKGKNYEWIRVNSLIPLAEEIEKVTDKYFIYKSIGR